MSKYALELLRTIGFLDKGNRVCDLTKFDDKTIKDGLQYYFDRRLSAADTESKGLDAERQQLSVLVSSISARNAVIPLLPSFLAYNRIVADDPVFKESVPAHHDDVVEREAIGIRPEKVIDRAMLKNKLLYFSELAPLIEEGFLNVLTLQMLHMRPDKIPLFASDDAFRSGVPEQIHDYVHRNARIHEVKLNKETGHLLVMTKAPVKPCRAIHVSFNGEDHTPFDMIYFLRQIMSHDMNEETRMLRLSFDMDLERGVDEEQYRIWVYQSINRTIIARLKAIASEIEIANSIGFSYLTESRFEANLLASPGEARMPTNQKSASLAVNFLNANLPVLQLDSPLKVARLRLSHAATFNRFHTSLLEIGARLCDVPADLFQEKATQLFQREILPQIDEIGRAADTIKASAYKGVITASGAIALALVTGAVMPFASILGILASQTIAEAIPSVNEYLHLRKKPEYIWSKLAR